MRVRGLTAVEVVIVVIVATGVLAFVIPKLRERQELEEASRAGTTISNDILRQGAALLTGDCVVSHRIIRFEYGRLEGGLAVLFRDPYPDAAFWVSGEKIYTVNDRARRLLPNHPAAPPEITYEAVVAVAD